MREQPTHDPLQVGPEAPELSRKLRSLEEGDFVLCEVVGDGSLRVLYPRHEETWEADRPLWPAAYSA